jgi:hypothetical protein
LPSAPEEIPEPPGMNCRRKDMCSLLKADPVDISLKGHSIGGEESQRRQSKSKYFLEGEF